MLHSSAGHVPLKHHAGLIVLSSIFQPSCLNLQVMLPKIVNYSSHGVLNILLWFQVTWEMMSQALTLLLTIAIVQSVQHNKVLTRQNHETGLYKDRFLFCMVLNILYINNLKLEYLNKRLFLLSKMSKLVKLNLKIVS